MMPVSTLPGGTLPGQRTIAGARAVSKRCQIARHCSASRRQLPTKTVQWPVGGVRQSVSIRPPSTRIEAPVVADAKGEAR